MNKSRRTFLGKAPAVAVAAGVGVASGKVAMASPPEGLSQLLDEVISNQKKINGRLYEGDDLILEVLRMIVPLVPIDQSAANAKLTLAESYIDEVPGFDPPGCCQPGQNC